MLGPVAVCVEMGRGGFVVVSGLGGYPGQAGPGLLGPGDGGVTPVIERSIYGGQTGVFFGFDDKIEDLFRFRQ